MKTLLSLKKHSTLWLHKEVTSPTFQETKPSLESISMGVKTIITPKINRKSELYILENTSFYNIIVKQTRLAKHITALHIAYVRPTL